MFSVQKRKAVYIFMYSVAAACALAVIAAIILRLAYGRSLRATIAEWYMKIKRRSFTPERAKRELEELSSRPDGYSLPEGFSPQCGVEESTLCGVQTYIFNPDGDGEKVIYFCGGGYVHRPLIYHLKFLDKLSRASGSTIILPVCPAAPNHTFDCCYDLLEPFCSEALKKSPALFMGDSSGGGLALGLAMRLKEGGGPMPSQLILLAPWSDLTMSNPLIPLYEKRDPRNSRWLAKLWAGAWSGGHDLRDYRLSPIYGPMNGLPPVAIYVGTRDILYPDCLLLYYRLHRCGVPSDIVIGRGLNHVYPIYPIPEAGEALSSIAGRIKRCASAGLSDGKGGADC